MLRIGQSNPARISANRISNAPEISSGRMSARSAGGATLVSDRGPWSETVPVPARAVDTSAGGTLATSIAALRILWRQVAIHERDHTVEGDVEGILTELRQIDEIGAGFEQRLYPEGLFDDVIVRGNNR